MSRYEKERKDRADFAAMVRGDHADVQSYKRYVLAQLRAAIMRTKLHGKELTTIGVALKFDFIDADTAIEWAAEAGVLGYVEPTEVWDDSGGDVADVRAATGGEAEVHREGASVPGESVSKMGIGGPNEASGR